MTIINFPDQRDEIPKLPPEKVKFVYRDLMQKNQHYTKIQSDYNFSYIKLLGYFLLVSCVYFCLQLEGSLSNFLIGTVVFGIGVLSTMALKALFLDPQCDRELAYYIKMGKHLEETYPNIVSLNLFHKLDGSRSLSFLGTMISRFGSFALVLILTAVVGIALSMKVGSVLAFAVGVFAIILLISSGLFFSWLTKRNFKIES